MKFWSFGTVLVFIYALVVPQNLIALEIVFPPGAAINVKDPMYGANPTDTLSDAPAIQKAIYEALNEFGGTARYVYLPNGTYYIDVSLLSKRSPDTTLGDNKYYSGLCLVGQSRNGTILKLKKNATAFGDSTSPKGMIIFSGGVGEMNGDDGFNNYIQNMTIDVGDGNPGAVGLDFTGNNLGGIQDVSLLGHVGSGITGISTTRKYIGPILIKNVSIDGFRTGILFDDIVDSNNKLSAPEACNVTVENLTLSNQTSLGISVYKTNLAIRGLTSSNSVPVIKTFSRDAVLFLKDANLNGGLPGTAAIRPATLSEPIYMMVRNVKVSGYSKAFDGQGVPDSGTNIVEFVYGGILSPNTPPPKPIKLPVRESPEYWNLDLSKWAKMPDPALGPGNCPDTPSDLIDDSGPINSAIAAAISQGKTTIWFPRGCYILGSPLQISGSIKHILGTGTYLRVKQSYADTNSILMDIRNLSGPLEIRHLIFGRNNETLPQPIGIHHNSSQTLILKELLFWSNNSHGKAYKSEPGAGSVFIENVSCQNRASWVFSPAQNIWARQFNIEGFDRMILNSGATIWIHGLKTEKNATVIETTLGGKTELFGGMLKGTFEKPTAPAFINNTNSAVSLSYVNTPVEGLGGSQGDIDQNASQYPIQVQDVLKQDIRKLSISRGLRFNTGGKQIGFICPLYVCYPP